MNKYQKALNRIVKFCDINNGSVLEEDLKILQELVDKETPKEGIKIGDRGGGRMTKEEYYKGKFTEVQKHVLKLLEIEDKCLANQVEQLFIKYIIDVENFKTKIRTNFDS